MNMKPQELFRVKKAVYGLLNAPKRWFEKLSGTLLQLGWVQHQLDKCLFMLYHENQLVGLCGIHVDDVLCSGVGSFYENQVQKLRDTFPFGSWKHADKETVTFCGCEVRQDHEYHVYLGQERFAEGIYEIPVTKERRQTPDADLTEAERTQMRQTLGSLNWRSTQTAPWLLATTSHLQGCVVHGKVKHLLEVNKLVRLSLKHKHHVLKFSAYVTDPVIVTFADSSFASRSDGSSQGGQITLLMDGCVMNEKEAPFSVISWTSRRLRRVARSSTSAEVQMVGNGLDIHEFIKLAWCGLEERLNLRNPDPHIQKMKSCLVTDSKNVYDGLKRVESAGLHLEELRTGVELLSVKERIGPAGVDVRWVDSGQELADGLTKTWQTEQLLRILHLGVWKLVYDPMFVSYKRKKELARRICYLFMNT